MQVFAHIHDFKIIIHFKPDSVLEFYGGSTMVLQWFYKIRTYVCRYKLLSVIAYFKSCFDYILDAISR